MAPESSRILLLIDALDECTYEHGTQDRLLRQVRKLQQSRGLRLFVTSRFIPNICENFEGDLQRKIEADKRDIQKYINVQAPRLSRCVVRNGDLQKKIKSAIVKAVDGMYVDPLNLPKVSNSLDFA